MVKAISKSRGDKKKAELIYLEWRIELLKEQAATRAEQAEIERIKAVEEAQMIKEKAAEEEDRKYRKKLEEQFKKKREEQRNLPFYKKDLIREFFIIIFSLLIFFLLTLFLPKFFFE